jgi:hypothetical protein
MRNLPKKENEAMAELDIKELIEEMVKKIAADEALKKKFMSEPIAVLEKLLGADLKQKLYDHVRVDGRVPYAAVDAEVSDIFSGIGGGKN